MIYRASHVGQPSDLKPANLKVRPDGTMRLLDFGLDKALKETQVPVVSLRSAQSLGIEEISRSPDKRRQVGVQSSGTQNGNSNSTEEDETDKDCCRHFHLPQSRCPGCRSKSHYGGSPHNSGLSWSLPISSRGSPRSGARSRPWGAGRS